MHVGLLDQAVIQDGARVVAVVHLDRDAQATLRQRGAVHALGTDLAVHALAEALNAMGGGVRTLPAWLSPSGLTVWEA